MLEKEIEKKVCDYAKELGFMTEKFTSPSNSFVPDRLFTTPSGRMFFIEFKREGAKPTAGQHRDHARRRARGVVVHVVDNVEQGKFIVDMENGL